MNLGTKNISLGAWLLALWGLLACQPATAPEGGAAVPADRPATVFYLLRHAEQATEPAEDPPLRALGVARAAHLAEVLAPAGVEAIYATPYRRAQATVVPLADSLGLSVLTYDPDLDLSVLIDSLSRQHAGQRICIVGHSSTIPGMVNVLLGANRYESLAKSDFASLFMVMKPAQGPVEVLRFSLPIPEVEGIKRG